MMSDDDLVARLRHTLVTHADDVDPRPAPWPPAPGTGRAGRLRLPMAVVAAVVLVVATVAGVLAARPALEPPTTGPTPPAPSSPTDGPPGGALPGSFRPISVTFLDDRLGWALGGTDCRSGPCTAVARTRDGGRSWESIPAPPAALTGPENGDVTALRFATPLDGWAFGPDLYATHDGGATWAREVLPGADGPGTDVWALEVGPGGAYAVTITRGADGTGPLTLHHLAKTTGSWSTVQEVTVPRANAASLVTEGGAAWLVASRPDAADVAFHTPDSTEWWPMALPCDGALAAAGPDDVVLACGGAGAAGSQEKAVFVSGDGGGRFDRVTDAPLPGDLGPVAMPVPSTLVVAASSGASWLHASFDAGLTWSTVLQTQGGGAPWTDLDFPTPDVGVVLEGGFGGPTASVHRTVDGGHRWVLGSFG